MTTKRFATVGWLLCFCIAAAAQSASPSASSRAAKTNTASKHAIVLPPEKSKPITIPRFDQAPVIDGKLDDQVWKTAAVFKDFYQINPGDNIEPSRRTEAFIGYD